jgi:hypothetical protein
MDIFGLSYNIWCEIIKHLEIADCARMQQCLRSFPKFSQLEHVVSQREVRRLKHVNALYHDNPFMKLLHPNTKCSWRAVSASRFVTMRDILTRQDLPWNLTGASCNPNITMYHMEKHKQFKWDWNQATENPNMTIEYIIANPERDWDWARASLMVTSYEMVDKNPKLPWVKFNLRINKHIDIRSQIRRDLPTICLYGFRYPELTVNDLLMLKIIKIMSAHHWMMFSGYAKVTMQEVVENPQFAWDFRVLTANEYITIQDIISHPKYQWDPAQMSAKKGINIKMVLDNRHLPWDLNTLSLHIHMTFNEFIASLSVINWNYGYLYRNPNVQFDCTRWAEVPCWNWYAIAEHPSVNKSIVMNNLDLPWHYHRMQYNKNFTVTEILDDCELFDPIDYDHLSSLDSVTVKNVLDFPDKPWDWYKLTYRIPLDDIYANPGLPWDINVLSGR